MEMDVLRNSQKNSNWFPKKVSRKTDKTPYTWQKRLWLKFTLLCCSFLFKNIEKARGILTIFIIIVNVYTVLCSDIFELPLGSTFCESVQYLSSTHQFHLYRSADHIKKVHSGSEFILWPWLEQLESFAPFYLVVPLIAPWLILLRSSFLEGDIWKHSLPLVKCLTSEADWWIYSCD